MKEKNNLKFYMRDLNSIKSLNDFKNIKYVIHCASMTNAEKSFGKKSEMYKNNLNCLKTIIGFCKKIIQNLYIFLQPVCMENKLIL